MSREYKTGLVEGPVSEAEKAKAELAEFKEHIFHTMYDALKWMDRDFERNLCDKGPKAPSVARIILAGQLRDYEPYKRYVEEGR